MRWLGLNYYSRKKWDQLVGGSFIKIDNYFINFYLMKNEEQKPVSALKLSLKASEDKSKDSTLLKQEPPPQVYLEPEEEEFQRKHREYLEMKMARKREEKSKVVQAYGMSSSDDDDDIGGSESNS